MALAELSKVDIESPVPMNLLENGKKSLLQRMNTFKLNLKAKQQQKETLQYSEDSFIEEDENEDSPHGSR